MEPPVLGIVGAGQLARMMYQSVIGLDLPVRVFANQEGDSAATVAREVAVGSWDDADDLLAFAAGCDVVTFDHELVDPAILRTMEAAGHTLRPSPDVSVFAQDKLHQRRELGRAGLPVPAFREVTARRDLDAFAADHGWPIVAKSRTGGYDGRGVWVLEGPDAADRLWAETSPAGVALLVEEMVAIERELAVAVVRRPSGEQATYAVTETVQVDGICTELLAPAPVAESVRSAAREIAEKVADTIDAVGVMAVELFVADGRLVLNELALRPHNSVHWTIEGARTSQFQNHARAVVDWPLGDTSLAAPAVATVNILGPADGSDPRDRVADALAIPGVAVHLYDKGARPGRKLGHVTAVGDDAAEVRARAWQAADLLTGTTDREDDR